MMSEILLTNEYSHKSYIQMIACTHSGMYAHTHKIQHQWPHVTFSHL